MYRAGSLGEVRGFDPQSERVWPCPSGARAAGGLTSCTSVSYAQQSLGWSGEQIRKPTERRYPGPGAASAGWLGWVRPGWEWYEAPLSGALGHDHSTPLALNFGPSPLPFRARSNLSPLSSTWGDCQGRFPEPRLPSVPCPFLPVPSELLPARPQGLPRAPTCTWVLFLLHSGGTFPGLHGSPWRV